MSIKTFHRIVFRIAFEHALKDDAFGAIGDMLGCGQYLYAVIFERFFMDRCFIFVAGETIKLVNEDIIEGFFIAASEHFLECFAVVVCPGHGSVYVCVQDKNIVSFCIIFTDTELSFDGLFGLTIAAVSCIDDCDVFLWILVILI